jgi:homoserine O-succinyltransferase/O-acetyltransferase
MPVFLDAETHDRRSGRFMKIGLINNMPDEALKATERQFISLLNSASEGMPIHLSLYTLPDVPRNEPSRRHIASLYADMEDLWESQLDGLIVTGREPLAAQLVDEPYWESFTKTLAWAQENAHSTIWSCLAAHAAILHLDGVGRIKSKEKFFGIFECARGVDHPLTAGTPLRFKLPHSRWNGVSEDELTSCGYSVLTTGEHAGVDTFIKQQKKLFVFFQGHPEYESDTLLREYRRDIVRYFKGETQKYPSMPQSYFNPDTADAFTALQQRAISGDSDGLITAVSAALENRSVENTWRTGATRIYRNWLGFIGTQKESALRSKRMAQISDLERSDDKGCYL